MSITVTVPSDNKRALALAGEFFTKLAGETGYIDEALPDDEPRLGDKIVLQGVDEAQAGAPVEPPMSQTDDQADEPTTDLDSNGLPWDARIHAGTKTRNADGSWKRKRGVDKAVVEQIEQELRDLMAIPVQDEPAAPPPPPAADKQPDLPSDLLPSDPASGATSASDTPADFPSFLRAVSKMMTDGTTSQEQVNNVLAKHGVASMPLVAARTDLIPQLWADIVADSEGGA